jgi:hypothetical protein
MRSKFLKRSDSTEQLASAINYYAKQPQTREIRRRLAKLRAKFAKLGGVEPPLVAQPGPAPAEDAVQP